MTLRLIDMEHYNQVQSGFGSRQINAASDGDCGLFRTAPGRKAHRPSIGRIGLDIRVHCRERPHTRLLAGRRLHSTNAKCRHIIDANTRLQ